MTRVESIPVCGVILAVNRGGGVVSEFPETGVGPSSEITYTIAYNDPRSGSPVTMTGVRPTHARWPDSVSIIPSQPGTSIMGVIYNRLVQFTIIELPGMKRCGNV